MAEIEVPKSPSPPRGGGARDDSAETMFKLAGGCCVTICGCCFGLIYFLFSLPLLIYGGWFLLLLSLVCMCLGCFAGKYSWEGIKKASG
jgi:uncharacterized membrane protein YccC